MAVLEMAIVLPLFLLIVLGAIEFGLLFKNYLSASNATRAGAACGQRARGAGDRR